MKIKRNFMKVVTYDHITNEWISSYINLDIITQICKITEKGDRINLVRYDDFAVIVDDESYDELVEVLYGKTYN